MAVDRTWMPAVAGILEIVGGAFNLFVVMILAIAFSLTPMMPIVPEVMSWVAVGTITLLTVLAFVAIFGGVCALKGKLWGLALAGAIAAFFPSWPIGIAAVVLTALGEKEFK